MGAPPQPPPDKPMGPLAEALSAAEQRAQQLIGNRAITFRTQGVQPPAALYISGDDNLQIGTCNSLAGQTVSVVCQVLLPDQRVQVMQYQVAPAANRSQQVFSYPLFEGYLMNVTCNPSVVPTRRGQTWVTVGVRRGSLTAGLLVQQLISDYADSFYAPAWPGSGLQSSLAGRGFLSSTNFGNAALGANLTVTVPANAHWLPDAISFQYAASAAVLNRNIGLLITDGVNILFADSYETAVTASQTPNFAWTHILGTSQTGATPQNLITRSLPDLRLGPGFTIASNCTPRDPGDQVKFVNVCVEEFLAA